MKPKIADTVPAEMWEVLETVRWVIDSLPDLIEVPAFILGQRMKSEVATSQIIPDCHVISHALARFLPVTVHDGTVSVMGTKKDEVRLLSHSWLTLQGVDDSFILDPWPLGSVGGPSVFIQDYAYHFGPECCFLQHRSEEHLAYVDAVASEIGLILNNSGLHHPRRAA